MRRATRPSQDRSRPNKTSLTKWANRLVVKRGSAWSAAVLGSVAVSVALIAATAAATPGAQPGLVTGPGWRAAKNLPGLVPRGPIADTACLSLGSVPGKGTRWEKMGRTALLDLHQLSRQSGAVAAGAGGRWNYAWPRDTAFVAVALARTGHHTEALQALTFLQRVQLGDGGFEARYLLDGSGPPDDRARQSDGAGWVLWAAWEVSRSSGDVGAPAPLRSLLDNATGFARAATNNGRQLPPAPLTTGRWGSVVRLLARWHRCWRVFRRARRYMARLASARSPCDPEPRLCDFVPSSANGSPTAGSGLDQGGVPRSQRTGWTGSTTTAPHGAVCPRRCSPPAPPPGRHLSLGRQPASC